MAQAKNSYRSHNYSDRRGEVNEGEEIVSCAGTYKGLDTALVVKTTHRGTFFREFEVREIIAKPICRARQLPEYKFKNWKGNIDEYYVQSKRRQH